MNRGDIMPQQIKEYEHYCEYCGKLLERKRFASGRLESFNVFKKRKYCNRECMKNNYLKIGDMWDQDYRSAHATAQKINVNILHREECEICGSKEHLDVHHKDGNYNNNNIDNLQVLCRSCHNKQHRIQKYCPICGRPSDGGYGYCNKHYLRYKKYGNPRMVGKCNGTVIESEN